MANVATMDGVELRAPVTERYGEILTPEAVRFVVGLQRRFNGRRRELLERRGERQARLDRGERPDFLPETARDSGERVGRWRRYQPDLLDRRVEITGPVERKMVINALNSGARRCLWRTSRNSTTPTWANVIEGQINLRDADAADHHV